MGLHDGLLSCPGVLVVLAPLETTAGESGDNRGSGGKKGLRCSPVESEVRAMSEPGPPSVEELVTELMELRRGHGLYADDLFKRLGPAVRRQCGVVDGDVEGTIRQKLFLGLGDAAAMLPAELRPVVEAALALHPETRLRFLHERMSWAAGQVNRDHPRTALRRIDPGFRLLAENLQLAMPVTEPSQASWYTRRLDAVLRVDFHPPQLTETRTIVAAVDDLDELEIQVSAPPGDPSSSAPEVSATMGYGGEIVHAETYPGFSSFLVRLPRPLAVAEAYEYQIQFTLSPGSMIRPYYVLTPYRRCDQFGLRVRFDQERRPSRIWRLDGEPVRKADNFIPTSNPMIPDSIGEITHLFTGMRLGVSYGVQWIPAPSP